MVSMYRVTMFCVFLVGFTSSLCAVPEEESATGVTSPRKISWQGPEGRALPFETHEAVEEYLRKARILSQEVLESGSTRPLKVRLEHEGIEAHAIFRHIDVRMQRVKVDGEIYYNFRDSHTYECAAYELSRMLAIDNVPPCVARQIEDRHGTLQLWIEQTLTEKQRRELQRQPEQPMRWAREKQTLRLFDALIANIDRNQGNMLIDPQGKLWFIDHTRSFGVGRDVPTLKKIVWCDRKLWHQLKALDLKSLERTLSPFLAKDQLRGILLRRDKVQKHLEKRMQDVGEVAVLFDMSTPKGVLADSAQVEKDNDFPANTSLPDLDG